MADDNREEQPQDQHSNDQQNKPPFRNPMQGFDPSLMKMGMMNPVQYQHFQQMMMMQQFRRQQMQRQTVMAANSSNIPPESQKPPTGYVCFKCGQPGHWIYYCPNVPKGQFVQRNSAMNQKIQQTNQAENNNQKPQELTCMICNKIMTDAVLIPCCGKSFCKECITNTLESNPCPYCHQESSTIDQLVPNRTLRLTIEAHLEKVSKEKKEEEEQEQQQEEKQGGGGSEEKGMPIQVFDSSQEERKSRNDMNWMSRPFMNNRFPGFMPDMNWMRNTEDMESRPPFVPFPGNFNNEMGPFPGMPQDMFGFNVGFNPRGGFNGMRGSRGRGRGGFHGSMRRRSDNMDENKSQTEADYDERPSRYSRHHHSRSRSPRRRDESREDSRDSRRSSRHRDSSRYRDSSRHRDDSRHRDSSRYRDDSRRRDSSRRRDDSRHRDSSRRRDDSRHYRDDSRRRKEDKYKRPHEDDEDDEDDEDRDSKHHRRRSRSPAENEERASSRHRHHHSSRHRSSRYNRSRERSHRDRDKDRKRR